MINRRLLVETIAKKTMKSSGPALRSQVAAYLLHENLTTNLDSIMRDVMAYRAEQGYIEAKVVSAYSINATVRKDVLSELKIEYPDAKSIVINEEIDPTVVGGLRIEAVNQQLDLTVRSKLNKLKRLTAARNA